MNITEIRQKYPQYNDMSDSDLSAAIQKKLTKSAPSGIKSAATEFIAERFSPNKMPLAFGAGLLSGGADAARGIGQLARKGGEFLGVLPEGAEQRYTQQEDKKRQLEQGLLSTLFPDDQITAETGKIVGGSLPYVAVPGGGASLLGRMGLGAATGAAIGGAQYVPEDDSRVQNMQTGALFGAGIPVVGAVATSPLAKYLGTGAVGLGQKVLKSAFPEQFEKLIAKDLMIGIDPKAALKAKKAADEIGINLTPAEASGSETAAHAQTALGKSKEGQEMLSSFMRERKNQEKKAIDSILNKLSGRKDDAGRDIRDTAIKIEDSAKKARSNLARPHYEASENVVIPKKQMNEIFAKYPVIQQAYKEVYKSKEYAPKISGKNKDSIAVVNLVKRNLGDRIESLLESGHRDKASLVKEAQKELLSLADATSGDYKTARAIFSKASRNVDSIRDSDIKRIADLADNQLQNVSKIIFDRNETSPKVLNNLRDAFVKKNPDAWRRVTRNEIDRRMSHLEHGSTGSKFYDVVLKTDADFNQFLSATKGLPDVQKNLITMRPVFKNLINNIRDKNIISNEASVQSIGKELGKAASKAIMSAYDKKAIEIITSGKWDKYLRNIDKTEGKTEKAIKLAKLLGMKVKKAATDKRFNKSAAFIAAATSPGAAK